MKTDIGKNYLVNFAAIERYFLALNSFLFDLNVYIEISKLGGPLSKTHVSSTNHICTTHCAGPKKCLSPLLNVLLSLASPTKKGCTGYVYWIPDIFNNR